MLQLLFWKSFQSSLCWIFPTVKAAVHWILIWRNVFRSYTLLKILSIAPCNALDGCIFMMNCFWDRVPIWKKNNNVVQFWLILLLRTSSNCFFLLFLSESKSILIWKNNLYIISFFLLDGFQLGTNQRQKRYQNAETFVWWFILLIVVYCVVPENVSLSTVWNFTPDTCIKNQELLHQQLLNVYSKTNNWSMSAIQNLFFISRLSNGPY